MIPPDLAALLRARGDDCSLLGHDTLGEGGSVLVDDDPRPVAEVIAELARPVEDESLVRRLGAAVAVEELRAAAVAEVLTARIVEYPARPDVVTVHLSADGTQVLACWAASSHTSGAFRQVLPDDVPATLEDAAAALAEQGYLVDVVAVLEDHDSARLAERGSGRAASRGLDSRVVSGAAVEIRSEVHRLGRDAPRAGYLLVVERRTRPGMDHHRVHTEVVLLSAVPEATITSTTYRHLGVDWRPPDPGPRQRAEPLVPWRLQLHLDLACRDEVELGVTTRHLLDALVDGWTGLTGTDPVGDPDVWLSWAAMPAGAAPRGSDRGGRSTRSMARLRETLDGGAFSSVISWHWIGELDDRFRPRVDLSMGTYDRPDEAYVELALHLLPEPSAEMLHRAEELLVGLLVRMVEHGAAVRFANVTDDNGDPDQTAFERATGRMALTGRRAGDRYLRSYSWVTYVPPDLVRILDANGGIPDGAVHQIRHLEGDLGVVVRASEHLAEHVGSSVAELRRALAPLLDPRPALALVEGRTSGLRVVWDDGSVGPLDHGKLESSRRAVRARSRPGPAR